MLIVRVLMNERGFQNGIYLVGKHKVERFAHRRVDLIKVRLVIGGDYNRGDSVPHCGHRLFLEAADRQDAAAQAYLAVIAMSRRTGVPVRAETIAVHTVTPADGPSLGIAPSGKWMCISLVL